MGQIERRRREREEGRRLAALPCRMADIHPETENYSSYSSLS